MNVTLMQKIFFTWFMVLTFVALFNLYHNVSDATAQSDLSNSYKNNKDRYEQSIAEHDVFRTDISFLKGQSSVPCSKR